MIITIVLVIAVAVVAIAPWWVTPQPPLIPVEVPSVAQA